MSREPIGIGHGHTIAFTRWAPDRELCSGAVAFDVSQEYKERWGDWGKRRPYWTVESLDPLTISPSVLCDCGDHGFIRNGRWVVA